MGVMFHWFKDIKVKIKQYESYIHTEVVYIDGNCASHSYRNRSKLQDVFMKKCGIFIPTIDEDIIKSDDYEFGLIEPIEMTKYCEAILSDKEYNVSWIKDRLNRIKSLSMQGYYIAYESE